MDAQAYGRSGTVHLFVTSAWADFTQRPLSMRCAKGSKRRSNVAATLSGGRKRPFRYSTVGQLAAIGRHVGAANIFGMNFSGFFVWWLWRTIYLGKLPRVEKQIRVALDWTLDLFFAKDLACVNPPPYGDQPVR